MITRAELQRLIDFQPGEYPVLSFYLNVDPSRRSKDKYMLWLRKLLKEVAGEVWIWMGFCGVGQILSVTY